MSDLRYRLAQWVSGSLPPGSAFRLAEWLADVQWRRSRADRLAVAEHAGTVLGSHVSEYSPMVREVFRNFGRYLIEFLTIHRVPQPAVTVEGAEHLASVQRRGHGAIVLTGHLGNWEVGAIIMRRMGLPISVVALPHRADRIDRFFNGQRARCGVSVIPLGDRAARQCLHRLRHGEFLGMVIDRDFTDNGHVVPVCRSHLRLPRGPAVLSLRSGAPVLPSFLIREGVWKFRLYLEAPIWPERRSGLALTRVYATVLERYVQRFTEQWLIFQPLAQRPASERGERPGVPAAAPLQVAAG